MKPADSMQILDELIIAGELQESSKKAVLRIVRPARTASYSMMLKSGRWRKQTRSKRVSRWARPCGKEGFCDVLRHGVCRATGLYLAAACACFRRNGQSNAGWDSRDSRAGRTTLIQPAEVQEDGLARLGSGINQGLRQLAERAA